MYQTIVVAGQKVYTGSMKNWNTDTSKFSSLKQRRLWELRQLVEYGFDGESVTKEELKEYWPLLRDTIDPEKRRLFELVLWNKVYSLPLSKKYFYRQNEIQSLPIPSI
jgi:hypothetical protein